MSVMYAEGLKSAKSSVTLQSTDRHGILGEKSAYFAQRLPERYLITIRGERGALQYGLLIAPERITWDHHTVPPGSP